MVSRKIASFSNSFAPISIFCEPCPVKTNAMTLCRCFWTLRTCVREYIYSDARSIWREMIELRTGNDIDWIGARSKMTCAFVPPNPNELTAPIIRFFSESLVVSVGNPIVPVCVCACVCVCVCIWVCLKMFDSINTHTLTIRFLLIQRIQPLQIQICGYTLFL